MKNHNMSLLALMLSGMLALTACGGDDGKDGVNGTNGADGQDGKDGLNAGEVVSTVYQAGDVTFTIDPAENTLAGGDAFALKFSVSAKNQAGGTVPLTGIESVRVYSVTAMTNATDNGPSVYWNNNAGDAHSMYCTLDGTYTSRGTTGNACTLAEDPENPGTYTGTWAHDGAAPIMNAEDDLNAPHRFFLRAMGLTDVDGEALANNVFSAPLNYIPATGELVTESPKDTVANQACMNCHGENAVTGGIAAHVGHNYGNVEKCVTCHNPGLTAEMDPEDAEAGLVVDLPAMIHRIHGGAHLAELSQYGFVQFPGWSEIGYPAPLNECSVCHSEEEGKTTWNDEPTRAACTGCHTNMDFATGQGHAEFNLAQADDSQCASCHATGGLSPREAHAVGERKALADLVHVDFTGATVDSGTLTVTADVTVNGELSSDLSVLGVAATLMGNVDSNGEVHRWASRPALTAGTFTSTGKLELTRAITAEEATGTIYVGTEATFCVGANGQAATCDEAADLAYGNPYEPIHGTMTYTTAIGVTTETKFFNLATTDAADTGTAARFTNSDRITVSVAKCEACHNSLDVAKGGGHGVYEFNQCMDCHNNDYAGSYHPAPVFKNAAGESEAKGVQPFANRDLVTVVHRYHSGNFDNIEGVHTNADGEVEGYPGVQGDCTACHSTEDGAKLFAPDGGLTSGKRSIAVTGGYISPVAESCRSCHTSDAALAHFKSNGATTADAPDTTADLPVESCSTCHAEGKTYGIDKVHVKF